MDLPPLHRLPGGAATGSSIFYGALGSKGATESADDRLRRLADWCDIDDAFRKKGGEPDLADFHAAGPRLADDRRTLPFASEPGRNMANILTMANWEISLARYKRYKELLAANTKELARLGEQYGYPPELQASTEVPDQRITQTAEWRIFDQVRKRKAALQIVRKKAMEKAASLYMAVYGKENVAPIGYVKPLFQDETDVELGYTLAPDLEPFSPKRQCDALKAALNAVLENEGNDVLKDMIYTDVVAFLADGARALDMYRNFVFMGPSGVGKTTWARLLGNVFKAVGLFMYGEVAETTANDYVASYLGQSGPQTRGKLDGNLENIVLLDEAYQITESQGPSGKSSSYGAEVITTIVDYIDKNRGLLMIIIAGYEDKMRGEPGSFLEANEGLDRRFPNKYVFPRYTPKQLAKMLRKGVERKQLGLDRWATDTWDKVARLIQLGQDAPEDTVPRMVYEELFSKQGGSIENILAKLGNYMAVPDKQPERQKPPRTTFTYENDMTVILQQLLNGTKWAEQLNDASSALVCFLVSADVCAPKTNCFDDPDNDECL